jgi:hypothetical protein
MLVLDFLVDVLKAFFLVFASKVLIAVLKAVITAAVFTFGLFMLVLSFFFQLYFFYFWCCESSLVDVAHRCESSVRDNHDGSGYKKKEEKLFQIDVAEVWGFVIGDVQAEGCLV